MSPERETIVFKSPVSSRAGKAYNAVARVLPSWRTRVVESLTPDLKRNAYDLAGHINEGSSLIVVGGDGQLRTAAEAAKLAGLRDVVIVPVPGGNSCDGSRTYHNGKNILRGNRLVNLLTNGERVPVNTLDISVNGQPYGTAVNYAGFGITAYSGEAVNGRFVRTARAKIPGSEHMNGVMRAVEGIVIGATVVRHLNDDLRYERDGVEVVSKELLYAAGHSLAGTFKLDGDALEPNAPQVVRYEVGSDAFLRSMPGIVYGLMRGSLASERTPQDTVIFSEDAGPIPVQLDGEHSYLDEGSVVTASIHEASFDTYVTPLTLAA